MKGYTQGQCRKREKIVDRSEVKRLSDGEGE